MTVKEEILSVLRMNAVDKDTAEDILNMLGITDELGSINITLAEALRFADEWLETERQAG